MWATSNHEVGSYVQIKYFNLKFLIYQQTYNKQLCNQFYYYFHLSTKVKIPFLTPRTCFIICIHFSFALCNLTQFIMKLHLLENISSFRAYFKSSCFISYFKSLSRKYNLSRFLFSFIHFYYFFLIDSFFYCERFFSYCLELHSSDNYLKTMISSKESNTNSPPGTNGFIIFVFIMGK